MNCRKAIKEEVKLVREHLELMETDFPEGLSHYLGRVIVLERIANKMGEDELYKEILNLAGNLTNKLFQQREEYDDKV